MFAVQILVSLYLLSVVHLAGCFLFYTEVDLVEAVFMRSKDDVHVCQCRRLFSVLAAYYNA